MWEVYAQLHRRGRGGFILTGAQGRRHYVKALKFAEELMASAANDIGKLREVNDTPIGDLIARVRSDAIVPVETAPIDIEEDRTRPSSERQKVFAVIEADKLVGWYLNNEAISDSLTQRITYVCPNGHRNPDGDHGTCYFCPFPTKPEKV